MKFVLSFKADSSMISRWANRFRNSYVSIDNDPRPEGLRTSTDERSVKLVAVVLEEDRRTTCEELSRATGGKDFAGKCTSIDLICSMRMLARTLRML